MKTGTEETLILHRVRECYLRSLLLRAAAQARATMRERRANLIDAYIKRNANRSKRCGFLWLRKRPLTERELFGVIRATRHSLSPTYDTAWWGVYQARRDEATLRNRARALSAVSSRELLVATSVLYSIIYYLALPDDEYTALVANPDNVVRIEQ